MAAPPARRARAEAVGGPLAIVRTGDRDSHERHDGASARAPGRPRHARVLLREQRRHVGERLEFERVARRIEKEHRRLFSDFALEADMRLDDELDARAAQLVGGRLPLFHRKHGAEMADRHVVAVDRARVAVAGFVRRQVRNDLVAVEIEVDPVRRTTAFRAAEQRAVELARGFEAVDGKGRDGTAASTQLSARAVTFFR